MVEWFDNQKKINSDFRKFMEELIDITNQRRTPAAEEYRRSSKLEAIADK